MARCASIGEGSKLEVEGPKDKPTFAAWDHVDPIAFKQEWKTLLIYEEKEGFYDKKAGGGGGGGCCTIS